MREIFFQIHLRFYGIEDQNDWYHISTPVDLNIINQK